MVFDKGGRIFNASACGDNCEKWIARLGKRDESPSSRQKNFAWTICLSWKTAVQLSWTMRVTKRQSNILGGGGNDADWKDAHG
ncbi:MAG: hypothetical protein HFG71_02145 [Hungatella sp.]|jgi:hypothetical protein|nr:hypothetical protein [Hungatella sp.]